MPARWLEGRPVAEALWQQIEQRAAAYASRAGRPPCLALVAGADPAAGSYARQIERQFGRHGLRTSNYLPRDDLDKLLDELNRATTIDGVLLLTPLAEGLDPQLAIRALDPAKDVDGQHPANLGRLVQRRPTFVPATALGGLRLLERYEVPLRGRRAVVVGRSPVVGLPLALLLLGADATVTVCHSRSEDLAAITRQADVLCVAVGRRHLIGPEHVRPGAVVLDFGSHPGPDGGFSGDVQTHAVAELASAITPVPGGTGPLTVAALGEQTVWAAERAGAASA